MISYNFNTTSHKRCASFFNLQNGSMFQDYNFNKSIKNSKANIFSKTHQNIIQNDFKANLYY